MKKSDIIKISIIIGLILLIFSPIYSALLSRFGAEDSYYSHGYLVPFVSIYLVWRKKEQLKKIEKKPCLWGIAVLGCGLFVHLIGTLLNINVVSYMMIPVVIFGVVVYLFGVSVAKTVLFPIVFLVFMLPLPKVTIIGISFKMKLLAAKLSTVLANAIGVAAKNVGSKIYYKGGFLTVGDPCSGLRSLVSFLALGAVCTQFMKGKNWKKITLFISTVPIALFSNVLRITFLIFVSYVYGEEVALGFIHDFSGVAVFVIGFLGLMATSKLLKSPISV